MDHISRISRLRHRFADSSYFGICMALPHSASIHYISKGRIRWSKYRRSSQLPCPAINLSRINLRCAAWPISPNALTANAIAKLEGSSLTSALFYQIPDGSLRVYPAIRNEPTGHLSVPSWRLGGHRYQ